MQGVRQSAVKATVMNLHVEVRWIYCFRLTLWHQLTQTQTDLKAKTMKEMKRFLQVHKSGNLIYGNLNSLDLTLIQPVATKRHSIHLKTT